MVDPAGCKRGFVKRSFAPLERPKSVISQVAKTDVCTATVPLGLVNSGADHPLVWHQSRRDIQGVVLHCTLRVTHEAVAMSDATFTFRVDEGLKVEFANAAKAHDRT